VIGVATSNGGSTTTGVVLCLLAAFAYAGAVVLQKSAIGRLTALQTTLFCCLIGALACVPFMPQLVDELGRTDSAAIGWVLYLGIFPTAIAFTTWAFALGRTSAGKLGATTYLAPPLSVLLGWVLLSEPSGAFPGRRRTVPGRRRRGATRRVTEERRRPDSNWCTARKATENHIDANRRRPVLPNFPKSFNA
jgi:EamA-like transporter family